MIGILLVLAVAYLFYDDYKRPNNSTLKKLKDRFDREVSG